MVSDSDASGSLVIAIARDSHASVSVTTAIESDLGASGPGVRLPNSTTGGGSPGGAAALPPGARRLIASAGAEPRRDCNKGHAGGAERRLHKTEAAQDSHLDTWRPRRTAFASNRLRSAILIEQLLN